MSKQINRFLHSTKAKTSSATTMIIIIAVAAVAYLAYSGGYLDDLNLPFSISGDDNGNLVEVNKKIQFTWTAEWSGTVANAKTFYIYDDTLALRETLTTAATGIVASSQNYPSGTILHIKYDDTNNQVWYDIEVPYMSPEEAQAQTYNDISLKYYAVGTYSSDSLMMNGLLVSDAEQINATGNATTTPSFVYTLTNTGADNTGILESYDPVYAQAWEIWVTGTVTGDNASLVIVNGVDYQWKVGNDIYFADKVSASSLSKVKIGLDLVSAGTDSCSFSFDLTGFTATSAATLQISVKGGADPMYAMTHAGNYGNSDFELAEQTVTLVDI